ncbi:MAG: pilin [bacterium]
MNKLSKKHISINTILSSIVLVLSFSLSTVVTASTDLYTPITDISGILPAAGVNTNNLAVFIGNVFKYIIWASSALAVIMIFFGGFQYATAQALTKKSDAKKNIQNALIGLGVVWGAYLLLNTINPQLVSLQITKTDMTAEEFSKFSGLIKAQTVEDMTLIQTREDTKKRLSDLRSLNGDSAAKIALLQKQEEDLIIKVDSDISNSRDSAGSANRQALAAVRAQKDSEVLTYLNQRNLTTLDYAQQSAIDLELGPLNRKGSYENVQQIMDTYNNRTAYLNSLGKANAATAEQLSNPAQKDTTIKNIYTTDTLAQAELLKSAINSINDSKWIEDSASQVSISNEVSKQNKLLSNIYNDPTTDDTTKAKIDATQKALNESLSKNSVKITNYDPYGFTK